MRLLTKAFAFKEPFFEAQYWRKMLSILAGEEWKEVRRHLSPAFSSGKIKKVRFPFKFTK